jgi:hypothetical protein
MYVTKGQVLCVVEDQQFSIAGRLPLAKAKMDTLNLNSKDKRAQ